MSDVVPDEYAKALEQFFAGDGVAYATTYITNYNVPPPPLKAFLVTYKGLWMGGCAVVLADCADTACDMVREDKRTWNFESVRAEEVGQGNVASVLFNDNGDY